MDTGTTKMIARKEDGIGWMIFNQPDKLNAVSYDMWLAVPRIIADYEADPDVRVIVLAGAGDKAFVSGADISEFEQKRGTVDAIKVYNEAGDHANAALINAAKPTVAMIRGYCIGGGLGIALTTDLRICGDTSTFAVPAAKLGLGYAYGGIKRLADVVGPSFAKEIFYTARQFTAEEARVMGLVNRIVSVAELEAYVRKYAATIAANAPLTVKAAKMAINAAMKDPDRRDLARVQEAVDVCFASDDYKEGRRAFMEKRKPAFKGR
ncbi:enoyl-CoA hydratase [Vineibacter terrae]|uniref:Enoyl-CoA hydratase n=1 Tax=Vineibacter terrae TaxID=2586908 RepID=A0A5C8PHU4_9HYPH|nr:enoyl-CoA hydratase [Vineibacter terrae]TXL72770.1 enoyl-CoA hydratase [Vineibacter terrae]